MTTIEVLKGARALVERGWCQGANAQNKSGFSVAPDSPEACCWCVNGALAVARLPHYPEGMSAWAAFRDAIGISKSVDSWNDEEGRTQAEVLQAFDAAIQSLENAA